MRTGYETVDWLSTGIRCHIIYLPALGSSGKSAVARLIDAEGG